MKKNLDLYSINNRFMVSISTGSDGNLRVTTYKWTHEIVPGYGEVCDPFWEQVCRSSITDTLEKAITIAEDEFKRLTGNKAFKKSWFNPDDQERMSLIDIVQNINEQDDGMTIYVEKPWSCSSKAALAIEPEDGCLPAELESTEFEYFLEIFIAKEFLKDWTESMADFVSTEQQCERLIKFAQDDA